MVQGYPVLNEVLNTYFSIDCLSQPSESVTQNRLCISHWKHVETTMTPQIPSALSLTEDSHSTPGIALFAVPVHGIAAKQQDPCASRRLVGMCFLG